MKFTCGLHSCPKWYMRVPEAAAAEAAGPIEAARAKHQRCKENHHYHPIFSSYGSTSSYQFTVRTLTLRWFRVTEHGRETAAKRLRYPCPSPPTCLSYRRPSTEAVHSISCYITRRNRAPSLLNLGPTAATVKTQGQAGFSAYRTPMYCFFG